MRTTRTTRTTRTSKKELMKNFIFETLKKDYGILGQKYINLCYVAAKTYPNSLSQASRYVAERIESDFKVKSAYNLVKDVKNKIKATRSQNLQNDDFSDFVCDAAVVLSAISYLSQESDNFYDSVSADSVDSDNNYYDSSCDSDSGDCD